jgi:N-acetylglutamate synthase-like GNAT family acetyltransferase
MNPSPLKVRRATVDDLPALQSLWLAARLPADELEARLTEFQIVENQGVFAGAIGVQVVRTALRLHSEDYADFAVADAARELFWERIQSIAANHGVFRVWTQEASPFWTRWGFQPAGAEILERLPDEWKNLEGRWLTLELKNEDAIKEALGTDFSAFMAGEKEKTKRVEAHAKKINLFIIITGFTIGIVGIAVAVWLVISRHPFAR